MSYEHQLSKPRSPELSTMGFGGSNRTLFGLVGTWLERRRQRRALAWLDERLLKDIGISREEAAQEIEKPFWR